MGCTAIIDKDIMVLQNHSKLEMDVQDPCSEMYPASCDASQAISMKVEVSDAEEEEGPVSITFLKIKADPEVRCMPLNVHGKTDLNASKDASCLSDFHLNVCEHGTNVLCWLDFAELFLKCLYTLVC
jgi:hypothetical protein